VEKITFLVRKAVEEDIPQVQELSKEAFRMYAESAGIMALVSPLNESYEDLQREIQNKMVFVAESEGVIIGSVRIEVKPDKTAYLSRFGVRGEFQNKGIGKILMDAIDESMNELEISKLYLHTASRMLTLVRFYYGRGFYIESTTNNQGYIRALLCKEYKTKSIENFSEDECENLAVI
jgi:N-acetylglutamate synthase-like GNAT family acetyltransferase